MLTNRLLASLEMRRIAKRNTLFGPFEADIRTSIGLLEGSTGFGLTAFLPPIAKSDSWIGSTVFS